MQGAAFLIQRAAAPREVKENGERGRSGRAVEIQVGVVVLKNTGLFFVLVL
jgi:hypothetical protein